LQEVKRYKFNLTEKESNSYMNHAAQKCPWMTFMIIVEMKNAPIGPKIIFWQSTLVIVLVLLEFT